MPEPRLLLFVTDLHRGGTPTVVRELSTRLAGRGHRVEVACLDRQGVTGSEIEAAGVAVHALGARGIHDLPRVAWAFRRLVLTRETSHVFSFLMHANAVAGLALAGMHDVRQYQSIQTTQLKPAWHWPVQGVAARSARKVIVPSDSVARVARERAGVADDKLVVIPNGVEVEELLLLGGGRTASQQKAGIRVGFLGRLDPIKRVSDLIAAMNLLPPHFSLQIYGDGADRQRLERFAASLLAEGRCVFHGAVKGPAAALGNLDVLVLPSEAEGFGLVLVESMAAGVPVVASRVAGIVDVVEEGVNGLMFPVGDVSALERAIRRVVEDEEETQARVRIARERAVADYGWEPVVDAYEAVLGLNYDGDVRKGLARSDL